jgi:hypothetical protein
VAIATKTALDAALAHPQHFAFQKNFSAIQGNQTSSWNSLAVPAAAGAPTTAAVPTSASAGAIPFVDAGAGNTLYLAMIKTHTTGAGGCILGVWDRLSHQGGLDGNINTLQTTNLATAALTRGDTNGEGVEGFLEVYTAIGATPTTATVLYTNTAGTGSRAGSAVVPVSAAATRLMPIQLQAGDTGIKSVQSVQLAAATGTTGNFGVTLARRISEVMIGAFTEFTFDPLDLRIGVVNAGAAIWFTGMTTNAAVNVSGHLDLIQG